MKLPLKLPTNRVLLAILALLLLGFSLLGLAAQPATALGERRAAELRWHARSFRSYEMAVEIEMRGETCYQQIEVVNGALDSTILDTCESSWLRSLTVEQLYNVTDQVQRIPYSRCEPSNANCYCQRVFTMRRMVYNPDLGYPELLLTHSEVRPNWQHLDFWNRLLERRELPSCAPAPRLLMFRVLWIVPRA